MITSSKIIQEDHSKAKIELYDNYLQVYMQIATKAKFNKVFLFDPFCGEGQYKNKVEGSPLIAVKAVKKAYYSNNKSGPNVVLKLNDKGYSKIEPNIKIIERVKQLIEGSSVSPNLSINYSDLDYSELIPSIKLQIEKMGNWDRGIIFIDPYGYKMIKISDLKSIMNRKKMEILLFLPMSNIYRFAKPALTKRNFPGGAPIKEILEELNFDVDNVGDNVHLFIDRFKDSIRNEVKSMFVDSFTLETKDGNVYSLFFFTNNQVGFRKMLEVKWKIDDENGRGFKVKDNQMSLFSPLETSGYQNRLTEYIKRPVTNADIYKFGLLHGFLPRHSKQVLDLNKSKIIIKSLDGGANSSYYIGNVDRSVEIKIDEN